MVVTAVEMKGREAEREAARGRNKNDKSEKAREMKGESECRQECNISRSLFGHVPQDKV